MLILVINDISLKYIQLFDWLNLLDKNVIIFFVIISFVASFNILSIIIILVMERIKMIGILKSFGAKTKFITSIFVRVGIRLLITGVCLGNVFAFFIIYIQSTKLLFFFYFTYLSWYRVLDLGRNSFNI